MSTAHEAGANGRSKRDEVVARSTSENRLLDGRLNVDGIGRDSEIQHVTTDPVKTDEETVRPGGLQIVYSTLVPLDSSLALTPSN